MDKSNKAAREALEKIYGSKCMIHEGIRKITGINAKKNRYKGKSISRQLTYHHLKAKRDGGRATIENGALLCRVCHDWLEEQSPKDRNRLNQELRAYKARECKVVLVDDLGVDLGFSVTPAIFNTDSLDRSYNRASKKEKDRKEAFRQMEDDGICI